MKFPLSKSERERSHHRKAAARLQDDTARLVRIWELTVKPKLFQEIDMDESGDFQNKKLLRAFVEVVSTRMVTEIVIQTAPESKTARSQASLKTEAPTLQKVLTR